MHYITLGKFCFSVVEDISVVHKENLSVKVSAQYVEHTQFYTSTMTFQEIDVDRLFRRALGYLRCSLEAIFHIS